MKFQLSVVSLCIFVNIIEAISKRESLEIDHSVEIYKKYVDLDRQFKGFAESAVKQIFPYILEASEHVNISTTCMDNLFQFMTGFRKLKEWSLKFLDSTGKPQSGLMAGNIQMFGEYNQCLDIVVKKKNKFSFQGQYCMVIFKPVLPEGISQYETLTNVLGNSTDLMKYIMSILFLFYPYEPRIGLCIPSGCTKEDLTEMINYLSQNIYITTNVTNCVKKEDLLYWTNGRIAVACVFSLFILLLVICTIFDNIMEEKKESNAASRIIKCFSVTHNFPKLINTDTSEDTVSCFYGIRVLSVFWIILCHEYMLHATGLTSNHALDIEPFITAVLSQIVLNGFTATEIFFFIGGFVNCYTRVKLQKIGKAQPSVFQMIIHRLWRVYPTLIVAFLTYILLNYSAAPYYAAQNILSESCSKNWWLNFLFINNFFKPFDVCLPHTWYLCADMQIFLLSLFTVPVLLRKEKIGIYLHIAVIFLACVGCFIFWWILDLPPSPAIFPLRHVLELDRSYFEYHVGIYMYPLLHIASYYIGILSGYVTASKEKKKFSKMITVLGWLAATFFYVATIFMTHRWNSGTLYTKLESSLYGSLSKPVLVLCVFWMVHACFTGQARIINYILSLKIWILLSRLTFMLYLISLLVQSYHITNINFLPDFASIFLIWSYFGNLAISLVLCLALVLIAESPLLSLEKIIFRRNLSANKSIPEVQKEITMNGFKENSDKDNKNMMTIHL